MKRKFRGIKFAVIVTLFQVLFIVLMALFGEYDSHKGKSESVRTDEISGRMSSLPILQDVNVMLVFALGFLLTFLRNYGFSSAGFTFLIAVVSFQWCAIVNGFVWTDILGGQKFHYGIVRMTEASFGTATVLISFCVVLGKTSPIQLIVMAFFEVIVAQINRYIGFEIFKATDLGESMYLHIFAAYFGMGVARVLYNPAVEKSKKENSSYNSDLFALAGTLFLWILWPSFNGGFGGKQAEYGVANTFLSLCAATVMVFVTSMVIENGKISMVAVQNACLAGGVAVGNTANMPLDPFGAMIIGSAAGVISTLGFKYLTTYMTEKFKLHDTCGVHNLHGIPGWISVIAATVITATATPSEWGKDIEIFAAIKYNETSHDFEGRSVSTQAGYQVLAAVVTTAVAFVSGILVGFILKLPIWDAPEDKYLFDDRDYWVMSKDFPRVDDGDDDKVNDDQNGRSPNYTAHTQM